MSGLEIRVNSITVNTEISEIRNTGNELYLEKTESGSGNSAAMDEFVSVYETFSSLIEDYKQVLKKDLGNVSSAVAEINSVDSLEGENILGINALGK